MNPYDMTPMARWMLLMGKHPTFAKAAQGKPHIKDAIDKDVEVLAQLLSAENANECHDIVEFHLRGLQVEAGMRAVPTDAGEAPVWQRSDPAELCRSAMSLIPPAGRDPSSVPAWSPELVRAIEKPEEFTDLLLLRKDLSKVAGEMDDNLKHLKAFVVENRGLWPSPISESEYIKASPHGTKARPVNTREAILQAEHMVARNYGTRIVRTIAWRNVAAAMRSANKTGAEIKATKVTELIGEAERHPGRRILP